MKSVSTHLGMKCGLEIHIQLNTRSKIFCGCQNPTNLEDPKPNSLTCEICFGMPGSRPKLNKEVVEVGRKIALTLGCKIAEEMYFSRKTYFYPDNSKDFQITQYEVPLGTGGGIKILSEGKEKIINIKRIHLEEDAAKTVHIGGMIGGKYSLIDYNRSGVPVAEIVTEPDITNPQEARAVIQKLITILEYLGVYDSSSRAVIKSDANVSVYGGERVEVKEITGAKEIEEALQYEIVRQSNLVKSGNKVKPEVRTWNPEIKSTHSVRMKEGEEEYGYIFEPDLPYVENKKEYLEKIRKGLPELPSQKVERFVKEYKIQKGLSESIASEKELAYLFEQVAKKVKPDLAATWIAGYLKKTLNWNGLLFRNSGLKAEWIIDLLLSFQKGELTDRNAELAIRKMVEEKKSAQEIIKKYDLAKESVDLERVVKEIIKKNPKAVEDARKDPKAINFLVGLILKETKGKADAQEVRKFILKGLE